MNRIQKEKDYWNKNAKDPDVENKYICDFDDEERLSVIGDLKGKILEIGCGTGRLMKPGYYGIDISSNMLELAKERNPKGIFALSNGRTIPFQSNFFDAVYSMLVFQHIPFKGFISYATETSRVLKKNGKFIFQFIQGNEEGDFSQHYQLDHVVNILESRGFHINSVKTGLIHQQWTWVWAEKTDLDPFKKDYLKE